MDLNIQTIEKFYSAFQQLNYEIMNNCYSEDIIFSDPVFSILKEDEVRCMWEMFCKNATGFSLTYGNIQSVDDEYYTCDWTARYIFPATGHEIVNNARAYMRLKNGKIIEHSDGFQLSNLIAQAFGRKGKIFGWMGWMKRKVQKDARKKLQQFMENRQRGMNGI